MSPAVALLIALLQAQAPPPTRYSLAVDCSTVVAAEARSGAMAEFKTGEGHLLASKWPEAESAMLKAVALDPLLAVAHYGLGQAYMSQKRFKEAVESFSTSRDAFRCVSFTEEERKQREKEVRELRDFIRTADQRRLKEIGITGREVNGDVRTSGDKVRALQDAEQRLAGMQAALKEGNPAPPGVTLALGTALFQIGAIAEAEVEFRAVLVRDPKSGDAHHNLALVCTITDRLEEAEREIAAAEKAGVPVHPRLKEELDRRKRLKAK